MTTSINQEGRHRFSVAHLLAALVAMFVVSPFVDQFFYGQLVESVAFTLVLLTAVIAVGGRRRTLVIATVLVLPAIASRWLDHFWPGLLPVNLSLYLILLFVGYVIVHLFRFVMVAPQVDSEVLCAALAIYLLFGVAWGFIYTLLARYEPNAFAFTVANEAGGEINSFTALYISMSILTAIAFGDYMPLSNAARMLALVEVTAGTFYVTILIARLVGLYSSRLPSDGAQH